MRVHIEVSEAELRKLVMGHFSNVLGDVPLKADDIKIEVKSKQNFHSEWEEAEFRAKVDKNT